MIAQIVYQNTGENPTECYTDALGFFAKVGVIAGRTVGSFESKFTEATTRLNLDHKGDGRPWRGRFVYDPAGRSGP